MNDFDLIIRQVPEEESIVIPVSDVHLGAIEHNYKEWRAFCNMVESSPNVYITLGGDLINNSVRNSVANPFDEVMRPREQKRRMVEHLKPIKDKILCAVSGNHEGRTTKDSDMDITYDIMAKLDLEDIYRENMAFLRLSLGKKCPSKEGDNTPKTSYVICVTHGTGGGIYTGATVNRNERFSHVVEGVDCFFVGHSHKGTVTRPSKIVVDSTHNRVYTKSIVVVSSESWMTYGGYALRKMLLPSESCNPQKVLFRANYDHKKDIKVIW